MRSVPVTVTAFWNAVTPGVHGWPKIAVVVQPTVAVTCIRGDPLTMSLNSLGVLAVA